MAQVARTLDAAAPTQHLTLPSSPAAILRLSGDGDAAQSPARDLHDRLVRSFDVATTAATEERLPLNTRLSIITGAVLSPWLAIGVAAYMVFA